MITFSENLSFETEQKLKQIEYTAVGNTMEYYFQAILIFQEALEKLRHYFIQQKEINQKKGIIKGLFIFIIQPLYVTNQTKILISDHYFLMNFTT